MTRPSVRQVALIGLVALMAVSAALAFVPAIGGSHGYAVAVAKLLVLSFLFARVHADDRYTMQWSSMFILLFFAEGTVRATSDPQPAATLGAIEAACAAVYFGAVLGYLRPLKRLAKQRREGTGETP